MFKIPKAVKLDPIEFIESAKLFKGNKDVILSVDVYIGLVYIFDTNLIWLLFWVILNGNPDVVWVLIILVWIALDDG